MKTVGMIGGMSWESTLSYYKAINEGIKQQLGGLHSAKICLYSVDFDEIESRQRSGAWAETGVILGQAAQAVQAGGADFVLICTNTMHKVAPEIAQHISIPVLHIADATGEQLKTDGITQVGLLGTRFTMEQDFYKSRLIDQFGMEVLVPDELQREQIHRIIFDELCLGIIKASSKQVYLDIIADLYAKGAQAIILGCTEIALLVQQADTDIKLYDTTAIHAAKAVEWALG